MLRRRHTGAGDELVATEIIFGGTLAELEPEEAEALLSALVFQVRPHAARGSPEGPATLLQHPAGGVANSCTAAAGQRLRAAMPLLLCQGSVGISRTGRLPPRLQEKSQSEPELTPRLQQAREEAVSLALQARLPGLPGLRRGRALGGCEL